MTLRAQDGQLSRLQHSYAFLFDIQRGVYVSVMMSAAMRTRPAACCKAQFLELVTAGGTRLRRRKEGADLCKDSAFMLRLVFALAHEFSPSCIGNRLCEMVILHHALNFQSLENQRLVIVHQSSRCLVKEVAAAALHLAVQSRQTLAGLFTILATFLLS